MPLATSSRPTARTADFEADARSLAARLEKSPYLILAIFTVLYGIGAMLNAHAKPFGYDEIVTVIAASQPDVSTVWKAAQAVDINPPLPHLLTHFAIRWFGPGEVAVRLPTIAGFWVFCFCLFLFTRRLGIFYALFAMLLPIPTQAYFYAFEARAYGLELGFCGLALVCWQAAARGPRVWLASAGVALTVTAALFCQYYAVLLYIPLAGAEAARSVRARRIAWPVWLAFAAGGAPLIWRLALIRSAVNGFNLGTWAPPYPEQAMEFWESGFQHSLAFLVIGLGVMGLWMLGRSAPAKVADPPPSFEPHEFVASILFLVIPLAVVSAGVAITHIYSSRYALPGLTGVFLLTTAMVARLSGGRAMAGFVMVCLAVLPLVYMGMEVPPAHDPFAQEPILVKALERQPVVLSDAQLYLEMWYYAPAALRPNILFLSDPAAASKYMGFDALDGGTRVLRPWSTVNVMDYRDFAAPGREFLVYHNPMRPGWILPRVLADGADVALQIHTDLRQLYRVRLAP